MTDPKETQPPEPRPSQYLRFIRLLHDIAAVPKAAIYELDPKLRPKPRQISNDTGPDQNP